MKTLPMRFRFKGDRDYIHGTDMYNQMMEQIEAHYGRSTPGKLRLAIHAFASKQCDMIIGGTGETLDKPERAFCELTIATSQGNVVSRLVETEDSVKERYEFDESRLEKLSSICGEQIIASGNSGFSAIEVAVCLTKQLHNILFPSNDAKKWVFTIIELTRPLERDDSSRMSVHFKQNFSNRLTKSELHADGASIGHIYFSLVQR